MPDNFTSENGQDAKLGRQDQKPQESDANAQTQLYALTEPPNLKGTGLAYVASFSPLVPRPQVSMGVHRVEVPTPPPLTCVETGMVRLLLEDALGLRVESEP